jgi:glucose/mannose-6-phosphate isomerase
VTDLDDVDAIRRLDSLDVLGTVEAFADHCHKGWEIGREVADLPEAPGLDSVVALGMGGSGFAADLVKAIVEPRLPVPFSVIKSYGPLPEWIGRNTLVLAISYSGDTAEVLAAAEEAHARGARMVTMSSGGRLTEAAVDYGSAHISIPSGYQPRAALGYLAMPLLAVLVSIGLVPDLQDDVDEAIPLLGDLGERRHRKRPVKENPAKEIALRLAGRVAVVYGGHGVGAAAAYRFKCDLNEYAKQPAFANEIPELNHNEIVGWGALQELTGRSFVAALVRDDDEDARLARRFEVTRDLVGGSFADVIELRAEGSSELARLCSLVLQGELIAIYVGLANDVDPGPVEVVEKLKAELTSLHEGAV